MKRLFILVLLLLSVSFTFGVLDEEAKEIYSSQELILEQTITSGVKISNANKPLTWVEADFNYFPQETYRQKVLSSSYNYQPEKLTDENILFKIEDVKTGFDIISEYEIKTENEYKQVGQRIPFPLNNLDDDLEEYLKKTELIDITNEIKATASTIASGKDDLFEVSQEVASWVVNNIDYDLNTITEDSVQKASWVMKNRKGVCDELSVLYMALMRSLGIPTRFVTGISYSNSDLFEVPWSPHAWAEVYFPGYGWVPFDLTYNQFGYIDASHVQFKATADVSSIQGNFQWKGYDLDKIDIQLKPTEFDMKVKQTNGLIDQGFDAKLSFTNSAVGIGSYNVLKIELENEKNYYLSSTLYLAMPPEVKSDSYMVPFYLKPNEKKTLYLLLEVSDSLSANYVYTMPVSAYSSFGQVYNSEFKVAKKYDDVSLNQVNAYLRETAEDHSNAELELVCNFEQGSVLQGNNLDVVCIAENQGNLYLKDGTFCMVYDDKKVCDDVELTIGGHKTFSKKVSSNELGNHEVLFEIEFDSVSVSETYGFLVVDSPSLKLDSVEVPESFEVGDDIEIVAGIKKDSISDPQNIDLRILVNNELYSWEIDTLVQNTDFTIPLNSYLFKKGDNIVEVFIVWEDSDGTQYTDELQTTFEVESYSFFDSIKAFFYRLIN